MDFIDRINQLATSAKTQQAKMLTEEATKNGLVMPFIQALGYNPFDLNEVHPEFIADVGVKKGEKVDYAIMRDGEPIMLFECKMVGTDLEDSHASQLYRYFSVTDARFAVLTNGTEYWFFTDLDAPNKMDSKPFLKFSLMDLRDTVVEELKKFTKEAFDVEEILSTATQLKYTNEIKQIIVNQLTEPDEELVKFFASHVHSGKVVTAAVRDQFTKLTRLAFRQFVNDQITDRLKSALEGAGDALLTETEDDEGNKVETTLEEHEGYLIVRAILREVVDGARVIMRDTQSYCGVLLDDINRKPICRLHFQSKQKYLGLFDKDRVEERVPISGVEDIYKYADRIRAMIPYYEKAGDS